MSRITIKKPWEKKQVFLMHQKQIFMKLYGNKSNTFLASWTRSKPVDEKKNRE